MLFLYTAWFRDSKLLPGQSNHEWSSCIVIDAMSDRKGREWGDYLAMQRVTRSNSLQFLSSTLEKADSWPQKKIQNVPKVGYGENLPTRLIGW